MDVSQDVIIREHDCGTDDGIWVFEISDGNQVIEPFADRLVGRYLTEDFKDATWLPAPRSASVKPSASSRPSPSVNRVHS